MIRLDSRSAVCRVNTGCNDECAGRVHYISAVCKKCFVHEARRMCIFSIRKTPNKFLFFIFYRRITVYHKLFLYPDYVCVLCADASVTFDTCDSAEQQDKINTLVRPQITSLRSAYSCGYVDMCGSAGQLQQYKAE